jgi:hypothetical protein
MGHVSRPALALDRGQGFLEVFDQILGILDTDGETHEAVGDAEPLPFLGGHAPMRRDRRVEHFRIEITECRRRRNEVEGVEEPEGGLARVRPQSERDDPAETAGELALRELVLGV